MTRRSTNGTTAATRLPDPARCWRGRYEPRGSVMSVGMTPHYRRAGDQRSALAREVAPGSDTPDGLPPARRGGGTSPALVRIGAAYPDEPAANAGGRARTVVRSRGRRP